MSDVTKRFVGERSVNWAALVLVLVILGGAGAGAGWLYKRQLSRQAETLLAQLTAAERDGDDKEFATSFGPGEVIEALERRGVRAGHREITRGPGGIGD